jgi:pSer/pThr/pTyr-binding forkhead associated (FHA) protein
MAQPPASPRPETARELQEVVRAERAAESFLLLRDDEGVQRLFVLDSERPRVTVGRSEQNDLALPWDPQVSAVHAELESIGGEWAIADDGLSRNGTLVNGARISGRKRLREGDGIRLGGTLVVYRHPGPRSPMPTESAAAAPDVNSVSDTQRRVLIALCRPFKHAARFETPATNEEIARELNLSVEAIKTHFRLLYKRFGLSDLPQTEKRARLAELALRWGLVSERDL